MAGVRERDGRFMAIYDDYASGKRSQKSAGTFDTPVAALEAAQAKEREIRPAETVEIQRTTVRGQLTVAGYAPVFLKGHKLRETSRENYTNMMTHVMDGLGNIALRELSPGDVRGFFRQLEDDGELADPTIHRVMVVLRQMCRTAVDDGLMPKDPTANIKAGGQGNREMRILVPAEYEKLHAVMHPYYRLLLETLVTTGLRWGECIALRPDAIAEIDGRWYIKVRRTFAQVRGRLKLRDFGKTPKATRLVSIDADLAQRLITRAAWDKEGWVFTTPKGFGLTRGNFHRIWSKALKDAGLAGIRIHDLRHTSISWLVNGGCPLEVVRDRAGHSNISVTSRYIHVIDNGDDPALDALARVMPKPQPTMPVAA
jgi:integrase